MLRLQHRSCDDVSRFPPLSSLTPLLESITNIQVLFTLAGSERKEHVYHYIIDDVRLKAENGEKYFDYLALHYSVAIVPTETWILFIIYYFIK